MKLKRVAALTAAGTLAISLMAGCGSGQKNVGEETSAVKDTKGKTTVTMMVSGTASDNDFETKILPGLVEEAFPDVVLEVTKLPDDQYNTALKTKLASGECPDIIQVQPKYAGANSVIALAQAGYLEPLTDLKALEKCGGKESSSAASYSYEGEVYSIPTSATVLGTFYNKTLFTENGLTVPTNWEEFLNCCEVLKNAGIQPIVMGDKDMYVMQFGLYQLAANQIYAKDPDYDTKLREGTAKFTDEGTWDQVISRYLSLYENGYVIDSSLGLGSQQAIQKFIDGDAAMIFEGSFNVAAVTADGAASFERGYFPLPGNDEGEELYAAMSIGSGQAVYSGSENKDICKQILELWYDGESDIWKAYADCGRFNVLYGYGSDKINPLFTPFIEMNKNGKSFYWANQAWPSGTEAEMEALLSEAIGGQGTTAEDITKGMQNKLEELLDQ